MTNRGASFWSGGARVEAWFRYAVKCDRDTSQRIETAAKKAGVSATVLVQQGFEAFCEGLGKAGAKRKPRGNYTEANAPTADEQECATRHGMTVGALRVYRAVAAAQVDGRAAIGAGTIAARTGMTQMSVRTLLSKLVSAGRLVRLEPGSWSGPAVYRAEPLGDEE